MNETFEPSLRIRSFQLMAGSSLHSFLENFTEQQTEDGVKVAELMCNVASVIRRRNIGTVESCRPHSNKIRDNNNQKIFYSYLCDRLC